MKQEATNTFSEGMILDLNPLTTPNNVMTNALNATLITFNGNEFSLQNDMGNGRVETAVLPTGYVPIGVTSYGGIIYVASYNPKTGRGQLGSFPSPERNLTQDEISDLRIEIDQSHFMKDGEIYYYYKRYDVMPKDVYLNPGDKFGLFISGSPLDILSFVGTQNERIVTFHPAILDDMGKINYIDDECLVDGEYKRGFIFGEAPDLDTVDGIREAFDKCVVYKGKRSGKLLLIVELETLEDFIVSRSIAASRSSKKQITSIGSTGIGFSDNNEDTTTEDTSNIQFLVKFYCSGWVSQLNDTLHFTGVKFEGVNDAGETLTQLYRIHNSELSMMFTLGGFKKGTSPDSILKYKITPYTELGPNASLARTGIINFNLLGTGNIILNEWRYYVDNNEIRINYGFDLNLLEGESVESVTFQFYDVFFDKLYPEPFICSSTINGNFNGSYNEKFTFPYDLKYGDIYKRNVDNHDYIYTEVLGGKDGNPILQTNQLIKNNLYLVKITIKTRGLVTDSGEDNQNSVKEFYRFLYTNGIFNQQYIENKIMNFSTIKVDPYEINLKAVTNTEIGTDSNLDYKVEYLSGVRSNNDEREMVKLCAPNSPNKTEIEDSFHKANLYEDWRVSNASVTLSGEIENMSTTEPLEGQSYYSFGEYNPGWMSFGDGIVTKENIRVSYDESGLEILNNGGTPPEECINYISYKKDGTDEPVSAFSDIRGTLEEDDALKLFGSDTFYQSLVDEKALALANGTSTSEIDQKIEKYEELLDTRFYHLDDSGENITDISNEGEEPLDPTIKLSNIYGRLIRRVAGNGSGANMELRCKEVRPCFYPGMSEEELQWMSGMTYIDGENISNTGDTIKTCGDYDGNQDYTIAVGDPTTELDRGVDKIIWDHIGESADDYVMDYQDLMGALSDSFGGLFQHSFILPFSNANYSELNQHDAHKYAAWSISDKLTNSSKIFTDKYQQGDQGDHKWYWKFNHRDSGTSNNGQKVTTVVAMCRTSKSSESSPDYCIINFGGVPYPQFTQYLQRMLSKIYLLQPEIVRYLYVKYPNRIGYANIYNTKVNIGIKLGTSAEDLNIKITKSPVRLYKSKDESIGVDCGDFSKNNIKTHLQALDWSEVQDAGNFDIEKDIWFKSAEDYVPGENPTVLQCSWLNIPFPAIPEGYPDENNQDGRDGDTYDINSVIFTLEGLTTLDDGIYLTTNLELGGNMDASTIVDQWVDVVGNIKSYIPTYIFIPGTSLDDFEVGGTKDFEGGEFTNTQVYYSVGLDGHNIELLIGNSTRLSQGTGIKLFDKDLLGGKHTCYRGMLVPSNDNGPYKVPVINLNKTSRTEVMTINLNKGGDDENNHIVKGFDFRTDVFFDINSSGLWQRGSINGTEPAS